MSRMSDRRWSRPSIGRLAVYGAIFLVGAVGTYAFGAPTSQDGTTYASTLPARILGCGLVGLGAGTLAALASVDPEGTGFGLFLVLAGVVAGATVLSQVFPEDGYLPATVIMLYAAPLAAGYLIAAAIADHPAPTARTGPG